jgi:hypothetical protein
MTSGYRYLNILITGKMTRRPHRGTAPVRRIRGRA